MRSTRFIFAALLVFLSLTSCQKHPEITTPMIEKDIIGHYIPCWIFGEQEPQTITILKADYKEDGAALIINIETRVVKGSFFKAPGTEWSGRIRLHYEWIVDQWQLLKLENLTFKRVPKH